MAEQHGDRATWTLRVRSIRVWRANRAIERLSLAGPFATIGKDPTAFDRFAVSRKDLASLVQSAKNKALRETKKPT